MWKTCKKKLTTCTLVDDMTSVCFFFFCNVDCFADAHKHSILVMHVLQFYCSFSQQQQINKRHFYTSGFPMPILKMHSRPFSFLIPFFFLHQLSLEMCLTFELAMSSTKKENNEKNCCTSNKWIKRITGSVVPYENLMAFVVSRNNIGWWDNKLPWIYSTTKRIHLV